MADKWVGVFALAAIIGFGSYVATTSVQSRALSVNGTAMLAQTQSATTFSVKASDAANNLCPKPSATEGYQPVQNKALWFPSQYAAGYIETETSGEPIMKTNLYGKSCSEKDEKARIYIISHCVGQGQCHADRYEGEDGEIHDIPDAPLPKGDCLLGVCSAAGQAVLQPASQSAISPDPTVPATPSVPAQAVQGNVIAEAYKPAQSGSVPAQQPAVQQGSQAFAQVLAQGEKSGSAASGGTTFPGQTQTAPAVRTDGPAFDSGGFYRPGNAPLTGAPPPYYSPGYTPPMMPAMQPSFGTFGYTSGSQPSRVTTLPATGSYTSGIASLVGGLFSVPASKVAAYLQSFTGTAPRPASADKNSAQSSRSSDGQVTVVLPYPMPTGPLPPPPTKTDIYAVFRAIAEQPDGTSGQPVPTGAKEDRVSDAFSEQEKNGRADATSPAAEVALLQNEPTGTTPDAVAAGKAASASKGAAPLYLEPIIVEIGVPVDITDLASYDSILAYLRGDWARTGRTALQNKYALAHAESQQTAVRAQIEALQDARAADICDDSCGASLTAFQNELPVLQSRVKALQTAVLNDAAPRPTSPPPTVSQMRRVAESLAEPSYEVSIPRSASALPAMVSVGEQEAVPAVTQTKSEAVVSRVVQGIWDFLKSIFLPPATEAAKPRASCSLFASLFGKCK